MHRLSYIIEIYFQNLKNRKHQGNCNLFTAFVMLCSYCGSNSFFGVMVFYWFILLIFEIHNNIQQKKFFKN